MRQAGDLGERALEAPHQLERALRALRVLRGVQAGVARERRDPLVQARVVLHRARAERIGAGVEVEVAPREPVVVADDLRLGDLGQLGRAPRAGAWPGSGRASGVSGTSQRRQRRRAAALDGALEDRRRVLALLSGRAALAGGRRAAPDHADTRPSHAAGLPSAERARDRVGEPVDVLLRAPLGDRDQEPVRVLGVVPAQRVAGGDPLAAQRSSTSCDRRVEADRELAAAPARRAAARRRRSRSAARARRRSGWASSSPSSTSPRLPSQLR